MSTRHSAMPFGGSWPPQCCFATLNGCKMLPKHQLLWQQRIRRKVQWSCRQESPPGIWPCRLCALIKAKVAAPGQDIWKLSPGIQEMVSARLSKVTSADKKHGNFMFLYKPIYSMRVLCIPRIPLFREFPLTALLFGFACVIRCWEFKAL